MRRKLFFLALAFLLLIPLAFAQDEPVPVLVEIGSLNSDNFPEIELLTSIRNGNNVPIQGLTAEDVTLTVNGEPVEIISMENITADNLPISVVLVIDSSESMSGQPMEQTKAAAISFLDTLAPGDEVAVVDFDTTVRVVQEFTTDFDAVRTAIEGMQALGRTALYDASYAGAEVATQANNERRFIILLGDGNEYGGASTHVAEDGIKLAADNNIQFYTIGLGYVDIDYLSQLADNTFGQFYQEPSPENLAEIYQYLGTYLRSQYVIRIDSGLEPDGAESEFGLVAGDGAGYISLIAPDLYPQVTLEGFSSASALVSQPTDLTLTITAPRGLGEQTVTLNGEPLELDATTTDTTSTATINIDPYLFDPGVSQQLDISVTDAEGGTRDFSYTFDVADLPPVFTINGMAEGDFISAPSVDVSVEVSQSQGGVDNVTYTIDGVEAASSADEPYAAEIDLLAAGAGSHQLTVEVNAGEQSASQTVLFQVDPALFITPSPTPTNTPTFTPTFTPTNTFTPTFTPSNTPTSTLTPSDTPEPTNTPTDTPEPTATDTAEPTATDTEAPTEVAQIVPSNTARPSRTPQPSDTPEPTATHTPDPTETDTPEPTQTNTPRPTATDTSTATATATDTATSTATSTRTNTPEPTETDTPEPTATDTPEPTETDTPAPTDTDEPTNTPTATVIPASNTPLPTPTTIPVRDVEVTGAEDDGASNLFLPIGGGCIFLLILIAALVIARGRQQRSNPR